MPKFTVNESIEISKPVEEVFAYVKDFENWPEWSPWLICERDCKLDFQGDDSYSWDGKFVGSGSMKVIEVKDGQRISYALEFLKPWKSKAGVQIMFEPSGGGTKVTWMMQSALPFFLFFLKKMMARLISMDYQRGLKMLKEQMETGSVDSELSYSDESIPAVPYVAIEGVCEMEKIGDAINSDFQTLMAIYTEIGDHSQPPFMICRKWKLSKGEAHYTVCCPVPEGTETPKGCISGVREACEAFVVTHTGAYTHLGNAWSAAMVRARSKPKLFKQSKKIMPFELYLTSPSEEKEKPIVTKVCLPKA